MLTLSSRNRLADYLAGAATGFPVTHLSLHSGIPDENGSLELSGGSYARQPVTWVAAAGGTLAQNADVTFTVPPGTVAAVGMWSALTGGTFLGWVPSNGGLLHGMAVTVADASIYSPNHSLLGGEYVTVYNATGGSLPAGFDDGVLYPVTVIDADHFNILNPSTFAVKLPDINIPLSWQRMNPDVLAVSGTYTVSDLLINIYG